VTFRYHVTLAGTGTAVATIEHVTVATNLDAMTKTPLPDDCRRLLEEHLTLPAEASPLPPR
jgi:acyl-CoA thioesterase FadM